MTTTADPEDLPPVDAHAQPPAPESPETPDDDRQSFRKQARNEPRPRTGDQR
jgi:hypothetical protein